MSRESSSVGRRLLTDADIDREFSTLGPDREPLHTLPARDGFKFRGFRKDGGRPMNCRLKHIPGVGLIVTAKGRYLYQDVADELCGWSRHTRRTKA